MKQKILLISLAGLFALSSALPVFAGTASAGTISVGHVGKVKPDRERDTYNPATDPLPEWLLLPENVNENTIEVSVTDSATTVTAFAGADKWVITTTPDGKRVTYADYVGGVEQFRIVTSSSYAVSSIYSPGGKLLKRVNGNTFFDETATFTLQTSGTKASAANYGPEGQYISKSNKAKKNRKLTKRQLNKLASKTGFRGNGRKTAVAIALAESRGKVGNVLCNEPTQNPPTYYTRGVKWCQKKGAQSIDRGLWQINNYWHKGVSDKCAFSPTRNARQAYRISNGGRDWSPWSTYVNRSYLTYL